MKNPTEVLALARELVELETRLEAKRTEFQQLFDEFDENTPAAPTVTRSLRSRILSIFEQHPGTVLGVPDLTGLIPDVKAALIRTEVGRLSRTFKGLKRVSRGRYLLTHTTRARMEDSR